MGSLLHLQCNPIRAVKMEEGRHEPRNLGSLQKLENQGNGFSHRASKKE